MNEDHKKDFLSNRNLAPPKWLCSWINPHCPVINNTKVGWVTGSSKINSAKSRRNSVKLTHIYLKLNIEDFFPNVSKCKKNKYNKQGFCQQKDLTFV